MNAIDGDAAANSYSTLAFADAWMAEQLHNAEWTAASDSDKESALQIGTLYVDLREYQGTATTTTQALKFPRNGQTDVPVQIRYAAISLALEYLRDDIAKRSTQTASKIKAGSFQIELTDTSVELYSTVVDRLLKPFLKNSQGFIRV